MRQLLTASVFTLVLLLMGCSGSNAVLDEGRSVSVTYTISGTVLDSNGDPVVGYMGLWDITDGMSNSPDYSAAISGTGNFSFKNLTPGRDYYVWVWITALPQNGWVTSCSPYFYNLSANHRIFFVAD